MTKLTAEKDQLLQQLESMEIEKTKLVSQVATMEARISTMSKLGQVNDEERDVLEDLAGFSLSASPILSGCEYWKLEIVGLDQKTEKEFLIKEDAHVEYVVVDEAGMMMGRAGRTPNLGLSRPLYVRIASGYKMKNLFLMALLRWKKEKKKMIKRSLAAWSFKCLVGLEGTRVKMQLLKKPIEFTRDPQLVQVLNNQVIIVQVTSMHTSTNSKIVRRSLGKRDREKKHRSENSGMSSRI
uniref:Uncharacterized protein n=1 Tax=Amorphochlora amoebiformis TaxID=1561963 RepID=A0A7S0CQQ1_9EUKA